MKQSAVLMQQKKQPKTTVVIVGAGPAGMAAALQLQRFGIKTFLLAQDAEGSLLKNAWHVENYLGISPGKSGANLLRMFRKHLRANNIETINAKVELLDYEVKSRRFKLTTATRNYSADYAIVATGTNPQVLPLIKNARNITQAYLFYEVFPLLKKRHKTIVIIGAGDAAFDYALSLAKYNKVIICNRGKDSPALPLLVARALSHQNITYWQSHKLKSILSGTVRSLACLFVYKQKHVYINADYLIAAVGRVPQKDFYAAKLQLLERQLLKHNKLFLVGDIKNNIYRQVAIAVSDGIVAAMHIFYDRLKKSNVRDY